MKGWSSNVSTQFGAMASYYGWLIRCSWAYNLYLLQSLINSSIELKEGSGMIMGHLPQYGAARVTRMA